MENVCNLTLDAILDMKMNLYKTAIENGLTKEQASTQQLHIKLNNDEWRQLLANRQFYVALSAIYEPENAPEAFELFGISFQRMSTLAVLPITIPISDWKPRLGTHMRVRIWTGQKKVGLTLGNSENLLSPDEALIIAEDITNAVRRMYEDGMIDLGCGFKTPQANVSAFSGDSAESQVTEDTATKQPEK